MVYRHSHCAAAKYLISSWRLSVTKLHGCAAECQKRFDTITAAATHLLRPDCGKRLIAHSGWCDGPNVKFDVVFDRNGIFLFRANNDIWQKWHFVR